MAEKPNLMMAALYGLGRLLPGDVIHDEAEISQEARANATKLEQLAAAEAKRARKAEKRRGRG